MMCHDDGSSSYSLFFLSYAARLQGHAQAHMTAVSDRLFITLYRSTSSKNEQKYHQTTRI